MMATRPHLEAVFVAADDPADAAAMLVRGLSGGSIVPGPDGQHVVEGLGKFMALEPATPDLPSGSVTLWFRIADVRAQVEAMRGLGGQVVAGPTSAGGETVATVRLPQGLLIGLIS
jgi:hypothetical protein